MALLNHHDILTIQADATLHNKEVAVKSLQPYNDLLFKIVCDHVRSRHDAIVEDIRKKIQETPDRVVAVSVPLWSYNVRYFHKSREQYYAEIRAMPEEERFATLDQDRRLHQVDAVNGWNWTLGAEFDGHFAAFDVLPHVPVDVIVRKTDLLKRLSTTLFPGYGWVFMNYGEPIHTDERCEVRKRTIHVLYSVNGNDPGNYKVKALQPVAVKYATHENYKVEDHHRVVLRGPGLAPPQTPNAPRRQRCPTCDGVEIDSD